MTERIIDRLLNIRKAALEIAYDNGMINRLEPEEKFLEEVEGLLSADGMYWDDLVVMDQWIGTLSEEDLGNLCCGEHDDMTAVWQSAPKGHKIGPDELELGEAVNGLLNDIFEGR